MSTVKRYRFPPLFLAHWIVSFVLGRRRSMAADGAWCLRAVGARMHVEGLDHLPPDGPFVLVANHYQRRGLWVGWSALLATCAVSSRRPDLQRSLHWVMTAEWPITVAGRRFPNPLLRLIFTRLARLYDFIALPAMRDQARGRATALRRAAVLVTRHGPGHALGFFPEGATGVGLLEAQPGSGDVLLLLSRAGASIVPCGVYECRETLVARFGPPIPLTDLRGRDLEREERDTQARTAVMVAIGRLLPRDLWGAYAQRIAATSEVNAASQAGAPPSREIRS